MDLLSTSRLFHEFLDQRRYLRNVTPSTIEWSETAFKALNAFCKWLCPEQHLPERLVLQTLTDEQIQTLLAEKPKTFDQWQLHALVALLLDTGVRIDEALTLRVCDLDFDNLLLTVFGKGRKERRIPFSFELRKVLFSFQKVRDRKQPRCELVLVVHHDPDNAPEFRGPDLG